MSEYKQSKYYYNDKNKEICGNSFTFYINKNVKYYNTVKNMYLIHNYNGDLVKTLNKYIYQHF